MEVSTSFLSSNYDLETTLSLIDETSSDYIHVDIMDGIFVQNKTLDLGRYISALKNTKKKKDVHFMVDNPIPYIDEFSVLKPEYITFHIESNTDIIETIKYIKEKNIKVGLSIKPATDILDLVPYLEYIDLVIVMTVEPGAGGQRFMFDMLDKVEFLSKLLKDERYKYKISVDGGINEYTALKSIKSGVNILVSGSYICKSEDYETKVMQLKKIIH